MRRIFKSFACGMSAKLIGLCLIVIFSYTQVRADWIDRSDKGGIVTASSQIHEGESKEMAFDNTTATKWLTGVTATGWIQFQFSDSQQYEIGKYSIASANDEPSRDPKNWTLYGSNDEVEWVVVDSQVDQYWSGRFERREFDCAYPGSFNIFRLDITANNGSTNLTGFSEMELLENVNLAGMPWPNDNQINVPDDNGFLAWEVSDELTDPIFTLYFSDSRELVELADPSALKAVLSKGWYTLGQLDSYTDYYWRVDVDGSGYPGYVWHFLTQQPQISCIDMPADIDYDCQVGLTDLETIAGQWLTDTCVSDLCAELSGTPGIDLADLAVMSKDWFQRAETVIINEIQADNETTLTDGYGEYSDWIELRNLGTTPQNLQGWSLSDDQEQPDKWIFPDISIASQDYLLVFASGLDTTDGSGYLHTNFKLSKDGQYLALFRPDGTLANEFSPEYSPMGNDETFGLTFLPGDGKLVTSLLVQATPGQENVSAVVGDKPEFSEPSGFYNDAFELILSAPGENNVVRYTTDGSLPSDTSNLYSSPIIIDSTTCIRASVFRDKYLPGKALTHSYIFPADVIQQGSLPVGFPDRWKTTTADYEMDPDIVNNPAYSDMMLDSLMALPSISIVTELDSLFDNNSGIYSNPMQEGVDWERAASIELLNPDSSSMFLLDCGLRIQGGAFRDLALSLKKSFRLVFKRQYGSGKLDFPLFDYDSQANESFDTITLRAGANDGYTWNGAGVTAQYIRDEFGRSTQRASGNVGSHGTFVHVYLNGLYWGLYNAVERPDNAFSAEYFGGEKEDWDALNSGELSDGEVTAWYDLLSQCQQEGLTIDDYERLQGNNPDGSRNPAYPVLIDMENYIDYMIINIWGGNGDWPHRNFWVGRDRTADSEGFKFYCWDYEGTMVTPFAQENKVIADFNTGAGVPHYNLRNLNEYRMLFADRVYKMFFNDGALTRDANIERYTRLADWVEPAIVAESARWGDMHNNPPIGLNEWVATRDNILQNYLPTRTETVLQQLRAASLYSSIDPPQFNVNSQETNGGYVQSDDLLSMANIMYLEDAIVNQGDSVSYHIPSDDSLGLSWAQPGFQPLSGWTSGITGVGYERGSGYEGMIGTNIHDLMYLKNTSVYSRIEFQYTECDLESLALNMKYDDGFIAYLNGVEVCRSGNIVSDIPGQASAYNHEATAYYESFDISAYKDLLVNGTNVLAIHGINTSNDSSDMIVLPMLLIKYIEPDPYAYILYTTDGSDPRLVGGDINPGVQVYSGPLTLDHSLHIKARVYAVGVWSALHESVFAVGPIAESLRVSEIMYHPAADPNSEFLELVNAGSESIDLALSSIDKGIDICFDSIVLAPDERCVAVRNIDAFSAEYPEYTGQIAGVYSGSLSDSGERIRLKDALGTAILDFEFKDSWFDITDGDGFSLVINDYSAVPEFWDEKSSWRPSANVGGSPGTDDSGLVPASGTIVINEIMSAPNSGGDWVELYNNSADPVNIGGWYLSDDNDDDPNRMKYRIADGTVINANDYIVYYQDLHFGNLSDSGCIIPFALSSKGETLYLQSASGGVLTGYYTEESFDAAQPGVAFARYVKSTGDADFVPESSSTPDYANAYPKVGPLVISEIMYHPEDEGEAEYVELVNISSNDLTLIDAASGRPWRFVDNKNDIGIEFYFPADDPVTLAPGEKLLLVKELEDFTEEFGAPGPGLKVYEWLEGSLSNSNEKPEIQAPASDYYYRVDRVSYDDGAPWPTQADGKGSSLTRIDFSTYANDPANWSAATPTPGS